MFASASIWLVPIALLPVLRWLYSSALSGLVEGLLNRQYTEQLDLWVYVLFVNSVAIGYVARSSFDFAARFRPSFLALFVLGGVMYHGDRFVLRWWTQGSVDRNPKRITEMVPALLVPPAEEVLYRGVLGSLVVTASVSEFLVVSAVLFGLLHNKNVYEISFKTINGFVYASLFVLTGTVVAPIAAHFGYNCATTVQRVSGRSPTSIVVSLR